MTLFFAAVALLFLSALAGAFTHRGSRLAERLSLVFCLAGCGLGLAAALLILAKPGHRHLANGLAPHPRRRPLL